MRGWSLYVAVGLAGCAAGDPSSDTDGAGQAADTDPRVVTDTDPDCDPPTVSVASTGVDLPYLSATGVSAGGVTRWLGLPYAASPTGERRFRAPDPPACRNEVLAAGAPGPICVQYDEDGALVGQEDCLYLNVFAPDDARDRPVFVWLHGGGHQQGAATQTLADGSLLYDGTALADRGVVVVTVNYRLGPFGFLAHEALDAGEDGNGNWGTLDQIAALRWVQDHIGAFGGDPTRVTVGGQSAGGVSACRVAASPRATGLLRGAVVMSGGCGALGLQDALARGVEVAQATDCDQVGDVAACLRDAAVGDLMATHGPLSTVATLASSWNGVVDGVVVPDVPREVVRRGQTSVEAVLVGQTEQETAQGAPPVPDEATLRTLLRAYIASAGLVPLPSWIDALVDHYDDQTYGSWQAAWIAASSDAKFVCPVREDLTAWTAGGATAWRYHFDERINVLGDVPNNRPFHGADLLWWFERLQVLGPWVGTADRSVAADMSRVLATFVEFGNPVGDGRDWTPWNPAGDNAWPFQGLAYTQISGVHAQGCATWASLVP